jgi:glutathione S-transferase
LYENIVKKFFNLGDSDPSMVKQGEERFHRFAAVLDGHLQTRDYVVGRGMTLADISAGSYFMYAKECPLPLEPYRAIQRWFAQLDELPAWRKAAPQPIN